MARFELSSDFLKYLADPAQNEPDAVGCVRLPSLNELSKELGVSVAGLREQLEVARALGFVDVRPHNGIRRQPYTFMPAVLQSLSYAIKLDHANFDAFADLRNHLEKSYWREAVKKLTPEDHDKLRSLIQKAWQKLNGVPIQIPQEEHRLLHLSIYGRLGNPFVLGILEAYWEAYEAVGLDLFADYNYLQKVWKSHQQIVEAICNGEYEAGYKIMVDHTDLLSHRPESGSSKPHKPEVDIESDLNIIKRLSE